MVAAIIGIIIILIILVISRKEEVPDELKEDGFMKSFYKIGTFIYRRIYEDRERQSPYYQKIYDASLSLDPSGKTGKKVAIYFVKKVGLSFAILCVGLFLTGVYTVRESSESLINEDNRIIRQSYDGKKEDVILEVEVDGQIIEDYEVSVNPRQYTKEQLISMLPDFYENFDNVFLGENESPNFVSRPVYMPYLIEGYPFKLSYDWDRKDLIDRKGNITENTRESGNIVTFNVTLEYLDFIEDYEFAINVYPMEYTKEEYIYAILEKALKEKNEQTKTDEYFELPSVADGINVVWREDKKNNTLILIIVVVLSSIAVFIGADKDLFGKVAKRNEQMMEDYPEIVSKITLLIGAGMTVRNAWKKVAMDYKENAGKSLRYAYEEMLFTLYEMENGTEETVCYSHFSQRIRVQKYVKLVSLLDRNNKKGAHNLIEALRAESRDAFEERKSQVERKGEEAGTKLLLPMMMMLLVVVVVIMIPAFMSI